MSMASFGSLRTGGSRLARFLVGPVGGLALVLGAALTSSAGCQGEYRHVSHADAGVPNGSTGGTGAGGETVAPPSNAAAPIGLAILSSDYAATSVALYDVATGRLVDDCVHSGFTGMNFAQALSGDATLPTQPQHRGELAVIDRKNAVVSYVTPASCAPRLQFSVSTGGFKSNPHDVISVSVDKAYVTRYERNDAPSNDPSAFDQGDDVVVVDPATGTIVKSISLSGQVPAGSDPSVQARPDRGVLAEGKVYVTLGSISGDFKMVGPGRVVVIDPVTDAVTGGIDLPGQKGCSAIEYLVATKRLYVSCGGSFNDVDQVAGSALVEIDVSGATPAIMRTIAASTVGNQPINFSHAVVLGETAFVGTLGMFPFGGSPGTPDAFYAAPLAGGTPSNLLEGGASNLGRAAADAATKKVFLPDGDAVTPRVRAFDASGDPATAGEPFEPNPAGHLPPREVAWY